ncbi:PDZ domain-containing protein [bacterium]|nr:PDZ domain-containing protein [bacterium]
MKMAGYFRFPTVCKDKVVFVCEDDLWEVATKGGVARRLTSNLGEVSRPSLSPDGKKLAFIGTDEGNTEVYCMNSQGGEAKRLTFWGNQCLVLGWAEDGKSIVFASNHCQPFLKVYKIYSVSSEGGEPNLLPTGTAVGISFGGGGKTVICRNATDTAKWKRYKGGTAGDIWIDTKGKGDFQRLLTIKGNLASPMWIESRIFFIADHEGTGNLYSTNLDGKDLKRHTDHEDFYARNPATDGKSIVYQVGGKIFLYDVKTDKTKEIEVEFYAPRIQTNRKFIDASAYLEDYSLHPKGHSVALTIRGKAITMANWEGPVSQHGIRDGVRYRLARWLNDGERIITVSDVEGEECLEIITVDGSKPNVIFSDLDIGRPLNLMINPKEDKVAFSNHRLEVLVVDLSEGKLLEIDQSGFARTETVAWSPDGKWLAYDFAKNSQTSCIKICKIETNEKCEVTKSDFRDYNPSFDPEGKYLYFLSNRDFNPVYDTLFFDLNFPQSSKPFLVTLRKNLISPFIPVPKAPESHETMLEKMQQLKENEQKAEEKLIEIDFEGIQNRVLVFPVPVGNYNQIWGILGKALFTDFPIRQTLKDEGEDNSEEGKGILFAYDFESYKTETLVSEISSFKLSRDRKTLIYRSENKLRVVRAGEEVNGKERQKKQTSRETGWILLNRIKIGINPVPEWKQMFSESWRLQRDHFWTPDMSKIDWKDVYERYSPLIDTLSTRSEFSDVMWEVQGELGTSHAYEYGGDYRTSPRYSVGKLGAEFSFNKKNWVVSSIAKGDSWSEYSSSLSKPGINVKVGDVLLKVCGLEVNEQVSPHELLVNQAGSEIVLTFADGEKTKNVTVKTLKGETALYYREWVEKNREFVHNATNGKVGYVHVPNMGADGYAEFHRYYLSEVAKESLIVDVRFNGGGHVSPLLLEKLARKRLGYDSQRYGKPAPYPQESVLGSIIALTNENAGSDGDIFSHCFKLMKLGKLIGKRTWGGVIGIWPRNTLADGTVTTQPEFSFWFKDVKWGVENYGTDPDIDVDIKPQDYIQGKDPQLERGIEEILKEMASKDYKPLYPDFSERPNLAKPKLPER